MNRTTLGAKSNKRCDRLNIFKTITVQKNPIVLTGCKRFSDITFLSSQISTFGMVIVCTGTDHLRRSVEIFVELSFQCRQTFFWTLFVEVFEDSSSAAAAWRRGRTRRRQGTWRPCAAGMRMCRTSWRASMRESTWRRSSSEVRVRSSPSPALPWTPRAARLRAARPGCGRAAAPGGGGTGAPCVRRQRPAAAGGCSAAPRCGVRVQRRGHSRPVC